MEREEMITGPDTLIDTGGFHTGIPLNKKFLFSVAGTIAIYAGLSFAPLGAYGDNCAKAFAFVCATIFWMITTPCEMAISAMLVATLGTLIGIITWPDVQSKLGTSAFYTMLGMCVVAMSMGSTKLGERLSYWFLYKFGHNPVKMVVIIGIITAIHSAFVSNVADIVLISGIVNSLLLAMGEKPGQSKLGKTLMMVVTMATMVGGAALINGAPTGNLQGIAFLNTASGDLNLTITYADWTKISAPATIICIVPCTLIYVLLCGVKNKDFTVLPPSYYKKFLDDLGPMGGSEYRWILITLTMIVSMLAGLNNALAALLFAAVCVTPGIGVARGKEIFKSLPWGMLLFVCLCPLIGTIITNNGVSEWLNDVFTPLFSQKSPLAFSIMATTALFLAMNLMVNAPNAAQALVVTLSTTLCIGMGYDPRTVLMPVMLAGGWMWAIGANYIVVMNKGYGWWEMKDPTIPGFVTGFFLCVAVPVINYLFTPLWGLSFYL